MRLNGENGISLTTWKDYHFHKLYPLANNPKIAKNLRDSYPQPYTIHDARHWIEYNQKFNPPMNFAIELDGQLVGSVLSERGKDELRPNMEITFWVGEPFWGKGIATEAIKLFTKHLFNRFDVQRVYSQIYDFNVASMRVLEKADYQAEAILKNAYIKNGQMGDIFQYVKLRGE
jgi:[ribosomal protein S5]-alanine N-acetyltransferase